MMKRRFPPLVFALFACAITIAAQAADSGQPTLEPASPPKAKHQPRHPRWSYQGETGPAKWGELDPKFRTCGVGKQQSPINIDTRGAEKGKLKPILFRYTAGTGEIVNTGHSIQVNLPNGGSARVDGIEYKLTQLHFHTPSEERIDSMAKHMVVHLVHQASGARAAVVAVLFKLGKENEALKPVFDNLPAISGKTALLNDFNPADILPADPAYYAYTGSQTTPPCSEELKWQVMKTPIEISYRQLAAIKALYNNNVRPLQPVNGRRVQVYATD